MLYAIIAISIIIATFVFVNLRRKPKNEQSEQVKGMSLCTFEGRTALGVRLLSQQSFVHPQLQLAIDEAFTRLFHIARRLGYSLKLNYTDFTVYIVPPERTHDSDGNYLPNFSVRGENYRNHPDYDPEGDGYVFAAEMVLSNDPCAFVIAEVDFEQPQAGAIAREMVHNGGEHIVLFHNDRPLYEATATHTTQGHPILS